MEKIEILAPAGNQEALAAAVESGADAVYLGGSRFNARAFADNFDNDALEKAVRYAHIRGVKVYITVNILLSDHELIEVIDYIRFLYYIGVDAIIVQDIALLKLSKSLFPELDVHCSTQMTVHNSEGARYLASLGADRIVAARELSLREIKELIAKSSVEVEAFVHGALCVSYSGQCLMSSLIGGRSGNRGKCAQPCRRRYTLVGLNGENLAGSNQNKYLMSTRDLNTYKRLKEIAASGIKSLKIEGRMKKPEYVAIVVKHYREAIDRIQKHGNEAVQCEADYELACAFNREFTEGYLFDKRNKDIVSIERPDNRGIPIGHVVTQKGNILTLKLDANYLHDGDGIEVIDKAGKSKGTVISGIKHKGETVKKAEKGQSVEVYFKERVEPGAKVNKTFDSILERKARECYFFENKRKIQVDARITMHKEEYPVLELKDQDGCLIRHVVGQKIEKAEKAAASKEKIIEQMNKTGDTPFEINQIDIELDDDCFVPLKLVNQMRREALELLSGKRADRWYRPVLQVHPVSALYNQYKERKVDDNTKKLEFIAAVGDEVSAERAYSAGIDTIYFRNLFYNGADSPIGQKLLDLVEKSGKSIYLLLPSISKDNELLEIENHLNKLSHYLRQGQMGIVISNIGQSYLVEKYQVAHYRVNHTLNSFNAVTAGHFIENGAESVCLSPELNLSQIAIVKKHCPYDLESIVFGYIPVMTTEYCPVSLHGESCGKNRPCEKGQYGIRDEKGMVFPVIKTEGCRIQVLNSQRLLLVDDLSRIVRSGIGKLRLDFYFERPEEISGIVSLYRRYDSLDQEDRQKLNSIREKGFTKGHFFRGAD